MAEHIGRIYRLRAAIRSTVDATPPRVVTRDALEAAYRTFRPEVQLIAEELGLGDEFERLFPAASVGRPSTARPTPEDASRAQSAASLLVRLAGWLDGVVEDVQERQRAEAYARERVKLEEAD